MINQLNTITIDLSALVYNLEQIRDLVGRETGIMGIVKADAYGHGLIPVSRTLEKHRVTCLGVAYLHEALELRKGSIRVPVVVLAGIQSRDEAREVIEKGLTPVLYDMSAAEILSRESERRGKNIPVYLKIDTGMGRLGIPFDQIGPFTRAIAAMGGLHLSGLISHLSSADETEGDFTSVQTVRFKKAVEMVRSMGFHVSENSLANSAGIMACTNARFDLVRPGIALYGGCPSSEFSGRISLRPVMHFKGRVLQVRDFPEGTPISYGRTYYTDGPRRIAIVSAGYADGLPRSMSNSGNVLIHGTRVPVVGMICMNLTTVDVTGITGVRPGDEAVFLGSQGDQVITGDDMAGSAGTIAYEVFCSLGSRHKKEYLS